MLVNGPLGGNTVHVIVEDNLLQNIGYRGMYIGEIDGGALITRNTFPNWNAAASGGPWSGINIVGGSQNVFSDNAMTSDKVGPAIIVSSVFGAGQGHTIEHNHLSRVAAGIEAVNARGQRIVGNHVTGSRSYGILVDLDADLSFIQGNSVADSVSWGLFIGSTVNLAGYGENFLSGNGGTGCAGTAQSGDFCDQGSQNVSYGTNVAPPLAKF